MARHLAIIALSVICVNTAMILNRHPDVGDLYSIMGSSVLLRRDNVSNNAPFRHEFNLTTGKLGKEILVQRDDGLLITCIDCEVEGQFALHMNFDIDDSLLNELSAVLLSQISAPESSALSVATSVVATGISSIVSEAVPIATSIVHEASQAAHSIIESAASPVTSATAEVTANAASIVSKAADGIKSAVPFLGDLFDRRDPHVLPRDADTLISEVLSGFNISITQQIPILANFNLNIRTGDRAVEVDLPAVAFGSLPVFAPSIIKLGIFELQVVFSPLALTSMIAMQSNTNVSLSFGAGLTLKEPLQITGDGFQETGIEATSRFRDPVVGALDPTLCVSASLGPTMKFILSIPSANVGVTLKAQLELPRISVCFERSENVDQKCLPNGPIDNALRINSTMSIGFDSNVSWNLPANFNVVVPTLPQLPQISAAFPPFERCLDLGVSE